MNKSVIVYVTNAVFKQMKREFEATLCHQLDGAQFCAHRLMGESAPQTNPINQTNRNFIAFRIQYDSFRYA